MGVSHSHLEQQIFLPPDLLFDECRQLSIRDLASVAGVNRRLRRTVRKVIRARVYGNLAKIIPHPRIPTFLATLTNTGSVIGGSIALAAINPDFLLNQSPNNVNIFTPVDTVREWQIYLNNIGFISSTETSSQLSSCNRVVTFHFHHRQSGTKTVIVYEATGSSCLTPIFELGYTSQMNFLTQDHLYCMHPHLTPQLKTLQVTRRTLTRQERREEVRLLDRGMVIMGTPEEISLCKENVLCRSMVRMIGRKVPRLIDWPGDKIGILSWGQAPENFLHSKRVQFWLGGECEHENCMQAVYVDEHEGNAD